MEMGFAACETNTPSHNLLTLFIVIYYVLRIFKRTYKIR